ncbi:MAG: sensor histidine kinase [Eubacteriales bacterium]|nr:sensor histidine kinase [Eubacteriales bacterium]
MNILKKIDVMKGSDVCLLAMMVLNFVIVCFMGLVPVLTQIRAANMNAEDFLGSLVSVPMHPSRRLLFVISIYIFIVLCIFTKRQYSGKSDRIFFWLSCYEVCLVSYLMIILDMSYTGVIFLIVAEYLSYMGNQKNWIGFLMATFAVYLFCNYSLVNIIFPMNSFDMWASFYGGKKAAFYMGIRTSCEIFNLFLMLLYVVLTILQDKREKRQIRELNNRLNRANEQLKDANEQLRLYAVQKEEMGEMKERNRLAREIHDTLGHILTGISVGIDAVQVLLDIAPDAAKQQLGTLGEMSRNGLNDVRRSVHKLKPDSLESKSIDYAIQNMVEETSKSTGAKIYFVSYGEGLVYEADEEETIFRLVQEGTTNSLRHGKATEIFIRLDKYEEGIEITLEDNGCGSAEIKEGFGLSHMRERVEMLGGIITFTSENGFKIHAVIPIRERKTEEGLL